MERFLPFEISGSGPSGSIYFKGHGFRDNPRLVEDFSHLRTLLVSQSINQEILEGIVASAPRLTSLTFNGCTVSKSWKVESRVMELPSVGRPVNTNEFVTAIGEERSGQTKLFRSIFVDGALEGDYLNAYKPIVKNPM